MEPIKNILDHKNNNKIVVSEERIAFNKKSVLNEIAEKETQIYPLQQNNIIYIAFSAAAAILLLFLITNNIPSTIDFPNQNMLSKNTETQSTNELYNQNIAVLDDYNYTEDEIIQAISSEQSTSTEDNEYIEYLITEDIDEDLLIEELL